jgi:hypothetical protein
MPFLARTNQTPSERSRFASSQARNAAASETIKVGTSSRAIRRPDCPIGSDYGDHSTRVQIGIPEGVGLCQRVGPARGSVCFRFGRARVGRESWWWVVGLRTSVRLSEVGRLGCRAFLRGVWSHGAFRPRPDGLKQLVDRVAGCGGHADNERASGRVRACSCGEATDFAVAQAVVDEGEDLAGDGDGGFVLAAPLSDLVIVGGEFAATVVANRAFDDRPAHEA